MITPRTEAKAMRIGIVGGSLVGLSASIALARAGIQVTVFERDTEFLAGTGLGVDPDLLFAISGVEPRRDSTQARSLPAVRTHRTTTSWNVLHGWLRAVATAHEIVDLRFGQKILSVWQDASSATILTEQGDHHSFDCILGADGYRSTVRRQVEFGSAEPNYLGALIWRGTYAEADLPREVDWAHNTGEDRRADPRTLRLVAYPIPGLDGDTRPGHRRLNWAWYDSTRLTLLEELGCVADGRVIRSAQNNELHDLRAELIDCAMRSWSSPWREYVCGSLKTDSWFATPLAEYLPTQLTRGRIALIGDAGHVAAPITGAGLSTGLEDVLSVAHVLGAISSSNDVAGALREYESERLQPARNLVVLGGIQVRRLVKGQG